MIAAGGRLTLEIGRFCLKNGLWGVNSSVAGLDRPLRFGIWHGCRAARDSPGRVSISVCGPVLAHRAGFASRPAAQPQRQTSERAGRQHRNHA